MMPIMAIYNGSCHCGRVRFKVQTELDHVRVCDCSICRRRGALIHRVDEQDFKLLTPLEDLGMPSRDAVRRVASR